MPQRVMEITVDGEEVELPVVGDEVTFQAPDGSVYTGVVSKGREIGWGLWRVYEVIVEEEPQND